MNTPKIWSDKSQFFHLAVVFPFFSCLPEEQSNPWEPVVFPCIWQVAPCLSLVLGGNEARKELLNMNDEYSSHSFVRYKIGDDIWYGILY